MLPQTIAKLLSGNGIDGREIFLFPGIDTRIEELEDILLPVEDELVPPPAQAAVRYPFAERLSARVAASPGRTPARSAEFFPLQYLSR
ncbi:MAG TPA: hypothetical protein VIG29_18580 [Vicinamibacteria bacterium]